MRPAPFSHAPALPAKLTHPAGTGDHVPGFRVVDQILLQVAIFIIIEIMGELP